MRLVGRRVAVRLSSAVTTIDVRAEKRLVWPVYLASLRLRHQCDVYLFIITVDPAVAAASPLGEGPGP